MLAPPPESVASLGYILIESNGVVAGALDCAVYHHCPQFGLLGWKGGLQMLLVLRESFRQINDNKFSSLLNWDL